MDNLLSPMELGSLQVSNRIVLPPMQMGMADEQGCPTDELVEHYRKYSSDVGLIIVEHSYVLSDGRYSSGQLGIYKDDLVPDLGKLAGAALAGGARAIIQLNHAGLKSGGKMLDILDYDYEGSLTEYSRTGISDIVDGFGQAASRAVEAGFDGVEVHGAHGFVLSQFVSPITNDREDDFGGSFKNRIRLPLQVVKEIKRQIGDALLSYRIGATDLDPRGFRLDEAKALARRLDDLGVDVLDVSGGLCGSNPEEISSNRGFFISQAEQIRKVVSAPVIGVGGITDPIYANEIIAQDKVDLIAVGRAQLNDPDWASRAIEELE